MKRPWCCCTAATPPPPTGRTWRQHSLTRIESLRRTCAAAAGATGIPTRTTRWRRPSPIRRRGAPSSGSIGSCWWDTHSVLSWRWSTLPATPIMCSAWSCWTAALCQSGHRQSARHAARRWPTFHSSSRRGQRRLIFNAQAIRRFMMNCTSASRKITSSVTRTVELRGDRIWLAR
jgi:hypothetical protein